MPETGTTPCKTCAHRIGGCCDHPELHRLGMGPGPDRPDLDEALEWCQGREWTPASRLWRDRLWRYRVLRCVPQVRSEIRSVGRASARHQSASPKWWVEAPPYGRALSVNG